MPTARTTADVAITNGDDAFLTPASLRQPADGLGPRAQKTIERIVEATREVFMTRGYAGTTVDEITRLAEVSRASFYTYFPSKREVLLAVGANVGSEITAHIRTLSKIGSSRAGLAEWVTGYFALLDVHGAFTLAWTQAAREDEAIRVAGTKRQLKMCKDLGTRLASTAGKTVDNPALLGLTATALLERTWLYSLLYKGGVNRAGLIGQTTQTLWAAARQPTATSAGVI